MSAPATKTSGIEIKKKEENPSKTSIALDTQKDLMETTVDALKLLQKQIENKEGKMEVRAASAVERKKTSNDVLLSILDNKTQKKPELERLVSDASFSYYQILSNIYLKESTADEKTKPWDDPHYIAGVDKNKIADLGISQQMLKVLIAFESISAQLPKDTDINTLPPVFRLWHNKRALVLESINILAKSEQEKKIDTQASYTGSQNRFNNFNDNVFTRFINTIKNSDMTTKIIFGIGSVVGGLVLFKIAKAAFEKLGGIKKWVKSGVDSLKIDTTKKVLPLAIAALLGVTYANADKLYSFFSSDELSKAMGDGGPAGMVGLVKLLITRKKDLPPEIQAIITKKAEELNVKISDTVAKGAEIVGVDKKGQDQLKDLAANPSVEKAYQVTKTGLKGMFAKFGIEDTSFLDSCEKDLKVILDESGFSKEKLEQAFAGTPIAEFTLPSWAKEFAGAAGVSVMSYCVLKYLMNPKNIVKLGWSTAKFAGFAISMYAVAKFLGIDVPIVKDMDKYVPKAVFQGLDAFGEKLGAQEAFVNIIGNKDLMKKITDSVMYIKKMGKELYGDLSSKGLMITTTDIRNLNPLLFVAHMMKDDFTPEEVIGTLTSAGKMGIFYGIFKVLKAKGTAKTALKGIAAFSLYCAYKESKKIDEIPNEVLTKEGLVYMFKGIEDTLGYAKDFLDSFKKSLESHDETRHLVARIEELNQRFTPMSPLWFEKVGTVLRRYGNFRLFLQGGSFALVKTGGQIVFNTMCGVGKSLAMFTTGLISNGPGSLISQGTLEMGRTMVPFVMIGAAMHPDEVMRTAKDLFADVLSIGKYVTLATGYFVWNRIRYAFTTEYPQKLVNGELKPILDKGKFKITKIISKKLRSVRSTYRLTRGAPGVMAKRVGSKGVVKLIKGLGWVCVFQELGEGLADMATGAETLSTNQDLGQTQLDKGKLEVVAASGHALQMLSYTQRFRNGLKFIKLGSLAASSGVVTIPEAALTFAVAELIDLGLDVTTAGFEAGEDVLKRVDDYMQESRGSLVHQLLANDDFSFGDNVLARTIGSYEDNELIAAKHRSRREMCQALIMKEMEEDEDGVNEVNMAYRLKYLEIATDRKFSFKDESHFHKLCNNSRVYADMMINSRLQQKNGKIDQFMVQTDDKKIHDLLSDDIRRSRDPNLLDKLITAYVQRQKKEMTEDENSVLYIPQVCLDNFDKLTNSDLLYYQNLIDQYTLTNSPDGSDKDIIFEVQNYLEQYISKIRFIYAESDYIDTRDTKLERRLIAFSNTVMGGTSRLENNEQVDRDPIAYAVYELAVGFGYTGEGDIESLKKYFTEDTSYYHGIYWNSERSLDSGYLQGQGWYVAEQGNELDDNYGDNGRETIINMIARIRENKGNVLSYKSDKAIDLGLTGSYGARENQEKWIADTLQKGLDKFS